MTHGLSRRTFLQLAGISVLSSTLLPSFSHTGLHSEQYARVLKPVVSPDGTQRLLPDTVVRLRQTVVTAYPWLQAPDIQTMPGYSPGLPPPLPHKFPMLVRVCVPSAGHFARCDVLSDQHYTSGYGSAAWAVDFLPASQAGQPGWIALADDNGRPLGWSQVNAWQPYMPPPSSVGIEHVRIDSQNQVLTVLMKGEVLAHWAIATQPRQTSGISAVSSRFARAVCEETPLSWTVISSTGLRIGCADWHNDFGTPNGCPDVQMHPYAARWLYEHLAADASIDFR